MCLLLTLLWTPFLLRLRIEADGRSLLRPGHPAVRVHDRTEREFAGSDYVVVLLTGGSTRGIFSPPPLSWAWRFTHAVQAIPGVSPDGIRGLASDVTASWTSPGLSVAPPVSHEIAGAQDADLARRTAESEPLFRRTLLGADGNSMAIYVPVRGGRGRSRTLEQIESAARRELIDCPGCRLQFLGAVVAESLLAGYVLRDLLVLLPLACVAIGLILFLWFRDRRMAFLGLAEAVVAIVWTFGLMGAASRPVTLVGVLCPVILVAYCVSDTIYIAQRFREKRVSSPAKSRAACMRGALRELARPLSFTSFTTCAGFLAFAVSPVPPLRDFGLFTSYGVLFSLLLSLLVVPGALLIGGFGETGREGAPRIALGPLVQSAAVVHWPRTVLAFAAVLTIVCAAGSARLQIQDSWLRNFGSSSPLRKTDAWFNANYAGSNVLEVVFRTGHGEGVYDPTFLTALEGLQQRLRKSSVVGGTLSLVDCLRVASRSILGRETVPATAGEAAEWALVYSSGGSTSALAEYVNNDASAANLWVFLNGADYSAVRSTIAIVNSGHPAAERVDFAGDAYLGYALIDEIARSLWLSLTISLVLVFVVLLALVRSVRDAAVIVLPVTASVFWNFGFMGWIGLPIGVATSTFSSIALGIGIDFAIQWTARLRELSSSARSWKDLVLRCQTTTGGAILLHSTVMLAGFGLMVASAVPPNRWLGLLVCINLVVCMVATLYALPAIGTLRRNETKMAAALAAEARS